MSLEAAHLRATDTASADTASMYSAEALAQLLAGGTSADILYPTGEQTRIIEAPLQPLLVIAGAGSGKTKTMADRVVWLVANGLVRRDEVLGGTGVSEVFPPRAYCRFGDGGTLDLAPGTQVVFWVCFTVSVVLLALGLAWAVRDPRAVVRRFHRADRG